MDASGEAEASGRRRAGSWVVWAALAGGILLLVLAARGGSLDYYRDVDTLLASPQVAAGRPVRVKGTVAPESIVQGPAGEVRFELRGAHGSLHVLFRGVLPPLFAPGREVVVAGSFQSSLPGEQAQGFDKRTGSASSAAGGGEGQTSPPLFVAYEILAKCPSKYEAAKEAR